MPNFLLKLISLFNFSLQILKISHNSDEEGEVIFYSDEEDDDDGLSGDYVKIPTSVINKNNIYLFARTDREKDIW